MRLNPDGAVCDTCDGDTTHDDRSRSSGDPTAHYTITHTPTEHAMRYAIHHENPHISTIFIIDDM